MPTINSDKISDKDIENALDDSKKAEALIDRVTRILSNKPESYSYKLFEKLEPFFDEDEHDKGVQRKLFESIQDFLNNN